MDFSTKLAQTRLYAQNNQTGVDSQEVYNEGILQALDLISEKSLEIVDYLSVIALNQDTLINIFKGIEPIFLNAGDITIPLNSGVQIGNEYTSAINTGVTGTVQVDINNVPEVLIKGGISGELADVNAANQLKITAV